METKMIKVYERGDETVWVPASKQSGAIPPRVFLPEYGFHSNYKHGYKSEIEEDVYFDALVSIQKAFINNESKIFWVTIKGERKQQSQYKAKWRHDGSLVSPSLGWGEIDVDKLLSISSSEVVNLIKEPGTGFAKKIVPKIMPVLADNFADLESKADELIDVMGSSVPQGQLKPKKTDATGKQFVRDAAVVAYVLKQAAGKCECCQLNSPFIKPNGKLYLEVHHVKQLSDRGADTVTNAIAVCPNCHRELHFGANRDAVVELVYSRVRRLIRE
ncbi:TPA: hypothetical protein I7289_07985 [Vibrio parahaemolyticus]|nr:hypothetical protein [Vibrio parahaemolyticus]